MLITETAAAPSVGKMSSLDQLTAGVAQYGLAGFVWFDFRQHGSRTRQDWTLEDERGALPRYSRDVKRATGYQQRR